MCLILFSHEPTFRYRLILAANRDEFFDRPAAPAQWWEDRPDLLAGRDLSRGGTWLGVTRCGRWAAVTNFREGVRPDPALRSRGLLTTDFLTGSLDARSYASRLARELSSYAGFNLLVGDGESVFYLGNRPPAVQSVEPGVHGLSNHRLNSEWPKVRAGRAGMAAVLEGNEEHLVSGLLALLNDRRVAPDTDLPSTGISREWERALSASFIVGETYGTRTSTILLIRSDGNLRFEERTFAPGGEEVARASFSWRISATAGA